jgi:hypothetical protein
MLVEQPAVPEKEESARTRLRERVVGPIPEERPLP